MSLVPLLPLLAALIVAEPGETPTTIPPTSTIAAASLLLDQLIVCVESRVPFTSFGTAISWSV